MSDLRDMTWYVVAQPPNKKRAPLWGRTCAVDDKGELWVPAALAESETAVVLCCGFDGEGFVQEKGHVYVRASWMEREYPKLRELLAKMRRNISEAAAKAKVTAPVE